MQDYLSYSLYTNPPLAGTPHDHAALPASNLTMLADPVELPAARSVAPPLSLLVLGSVRINQQICPGLIMAMHS
jgi:hypothetical protein